MYHRNWKVIFWGQPHSLTQLVSQLVKLLASKLRKSKNRGALYFSNCYNGPMVGIYQLTSIGRKTLCVCLVPLLLNCMLSLYYIFFESGLLK